jgi:16S rRNA (cytidine1402-2'-O)-methyltransferase
MQDSGVHVQRSEAPGPAEAAGAASRFVAAPSTLYVVATPLGNLRDITLRAQDILRSADVIAAEDTRVTAVLLRHLGIQARPLSLHAHNEAKRAAEIVGVLRSGRSVALVSDAGTPAVSDPGAALVAAIRNAGFGVVPVPGANAAIAAISAAGIGAERFAFLGFLPSVAKRRRELVQEMGALSLALVIYEAPHRVRETVAELAQWLEGTRTLVIARELTKKFESIAAMPLVDASEWLAGDPDRQRGEFVLIVDARPAADRAETVGIAPDVMRWLALLAHELPPARLARIAAAATGIPRDILYARAQRLKGEQEGQG